MVTVNLSTKRTCRNRDNHIKPQRSIRLRDYGKLEKRISKDGATRVLELFASGKRAVVRKSRERVRSDN